MMKLLDLILDTQNILEDLSDYIYEETYDKNFKNEY